MRGEALYWVLNMSILGTFAGFIVLLIRKISRIPRRLVRALWLVPCLRLWIPFGLNAKLSFLNLVGENAVKKVPISPEFSMANSVRLAEDYFPVVYEKSFVEKIFFGAEIAWLTGCAAILLLFIVSYAFALREKGTESPYTVGIISPKIILPDNLGGEEKRFVLVHERTHIKRHDNLWRALAAATCALHWFNPFIWLFLKCFCEDTELSCDESVIEKLGEKERLMYAETILNCEERRALFASAFGGARTKKRIEMIVSYKAMGAVSAAAVIIFSLFLAAALLTNKM